MIKKTGRIMKRFNGRTGRIMKRLREKNWKDNEKNWKDNEENEINYLPIYLVFFYFHLFSFIA